MNILSSQIRLPGYQGGPWVKGLVWYGLSKIYKGTQLKLAYKTSKHKPLYSCHGLTFDNIFHAIILFD